MTDKETVRKLVEAGEKATHGEWFGSHRKDATGMYSTQLFTQNDESIATLHWYKKDLGNGCTGTYREENLEFLKQAANARPALKFLLERVDRYEKALNNIAYGMKSYGDTAKELQIEAQQALEGEE